MNIVALIFLLIAGYVVLLLSGMHQVKQGYVGLYKKFGVLQKKLSSPGLHFMVPFQDQFIPIKVRVQTDTIRNIPCGTADGTLMEFEKVEVVHKLKQKFVYQTVLNYTEDYQKIWISDKIHHQINQFCSKHSLQQIYIDIFEQLDEELTKALNKDLKKWVKGIKIISIRVTKPTIPEKIRLNFQEMEKKKVDFYIATEKEKVKISEQMTKQKQEVIKAETEYEVQLIQFKKEIEKKENERKMAVIEADTTLEKMKTQIQVQFLADLEQAKLYPEVYTEEYLNFLVADSFTSNVQFKLGNKIPKGMMGKI